MSELQRDKTFEPTGIQGKLKIVLHDVSGTLIRALGTIERRGNHNPDVQSCPRLGLMFQIHHVGQF